MCHRPDIPAHWITPDDGYMHLCVAKGTLHGARLLTALRPPAGYIPPRPTPAQLSTVPQAAPTYPHPYHTPSISSSSNPSPTPHTPSPA